MKPKPISAHALNRGPMFAISDSATVVSRPIASHWTLPLRRNAKTGSAELADVVWACREIPLVVAAATKTQAIRTK